MKKLIALVAALVMVAGTAYAAEWDFYGSARINTAWTDTEVPGAADQDDYSQSLQGNSRIGAKVKVSDELSGRFEYGSTPNLRLLYGEWNFGAGSFLVGQDYTPLNYFYSNQIFDGDTDLLPWGGVYSGREAQLKLKFGGFHVALLAPSTTSGTTAAVSGYTTRTEKSMPGIEVNYSFSMNNFSANIGGGYQTFEAFNAAGASVDVDSYVIAGGGKFSFGPAYLAGNIYFGENADLMFWTDYNGSAAAAKPQRTVTGNSVNDFENMGYILVGGAKINDMFSVEAGYGYAELDIDNGSDNEVSSYYLQATVTLAPGVFFVPEIGMVDYEEATENEITYMAVKWQINF